MYLHVVLMAFHQEVTPSLRAQIQDCFRTVARASEGVERFELVDNRSRTSPDYPYALLSVFATEQALDAYRTSDAHDELMALLGPHIRQIVVLDSPLDTRPL